MTSSETEFNDEELIDMLRNNVGVSEAACRAAKKAADRIEALRAALDEAEDRIRKICLDALISYGQVEAERDALAAQLDASNALLREARADLEHYVTAEYPKDEHPYYERQWNRDMELCRRIDTHLGVKP